MQIQFQDEFRETYQRNNKSAHTKNLRCFPACRPTGHCSSGFCGSPVTVLFHAGTPLKSDHLFAWGDFRALDQNEELGFDETAGLSLAEMQQRERSRVHPGNDLFKGNIQQDRNNANVWHISFGVENGWHYAWHSRKTTNHICHTFRVQIFLYDHVSEVLSLVGSEFSPKFKIHSKRKNLRQRKQKLVDKIPATQLFNEPLARPVKVLPTQPTQPRACEDDEVLLFRSFFEDDSIKNLIDRQFVDTFKARFDTIRKEVTLLLRLDSYFVYYSAPNPDLNNLSFINKLGYPPTSIKLEKDVEDQVLGELNLPLFDFPNFATTERSEEHTLRSVIQEMMPGGELVSELDNLDAICLGLQKYLTMNKISEDDAKVFKYWETPQKQAFLYNRLQKQRMYLNENLHIDVASLEYFLYLHAERSLTPEAFSAFKCLGEFHHVLFSRTMSFLRELMNSNDVSYCLSSVENILTFIGDQGLFPIDDTTLPSESVAAFISKQIHGSQGVEQSSLKHMQTDLLYLRRSIVMARRIMYARGILGRAKQSSTFNTVGSDIMTRLESMNLDETALSDLSGVWKLHQTAVSSVAETPDLFGLIDRLWNLSISKMYGYACRILFQSITVIICDEAMTIESSSYLGIQTKLIFVFDRQIRSTTFPELPFESSISNKRYIAWVEKNSKELVNLRFVFAMELNHEQLETNEVNSNLANDLRSVSSNNHSYNIRGRYARIALDVMIDRLNNSFRCTLAVFFYESEYKRDTSGQKRMKKEPSQSLPDDKEKRYSNTVAPELDITPALQELFQEKTELDKYCCFCTSAFSNFHR